jgi:hypothetical protein
VTHEDVVTGYIDHDEVSGEDVVALAGTPIVGHSVDVEAHVDLERQSQLVGGVIHRARSDERVASGTAYEPKSVVVVSRPKCVVTRFPVNERRDAAAGRGSVVPVSEVHLR